MTYIPVHPRLRAWFELNEILIVAAETGARRAAIALRRRRGRVGHVRRPGADTPMWNVFATELKAALAPRRAKIRLARYLGIPKQRVHNFLRERSRLPDAEMTLRMLHWLIEQRTGRDRTL